MKSIVPLLRQLAVVSIAGLIVGAAAGQFPGLRYAWVALFGLAVGMSELVSRYRDAPERALRTLPAAVYAGFNVVASVIALRLIEINDWLHTAGASRQQTDSLRVLRGGFGAMAILRSSVFLTRVGNQDVQVGPITFLQVVLGAADRAVDRLRGVSRADRARTYMAGVNFDKAAMVLPAFCIALMQNLSGDDQKLLANDLALLDKMQSDPQTKAMIMGLKLMNTVGEGVLEAAVKSLAAQIKDAVDVVVNGGKDAEVKVGQSLQLKVEARDRSGLVIPGKVVVLHSRDPTVAVDSFRG